MDFGQIQFNFAGAISDMEEVVITNKRTEELV